MEIKTEQELRTIYGDAKGRAKLKQLSQLETHSRQFIALSPFLVLSTGNDTGELDASPRGGEPGFVYIVDNHTLLIPDAKGNNRLDSLVNILSNHQVGCLFFIPGVDETLRINGIASIHTTPEYLEPFSHFNNAPISVIHVQIKEVFLHCAKFKVVEC